MPTTLQPPAAACAPSPLHRDCPGAREMLEAAEVFGVAGVGRLVLINNPGAYPAAYRCADCGAEFWQQFPGADIEKL